LGNRGKVDFGVPFQPVLPNCCEGKNKDPTVVKGVFHRFPTPYDDYFVYLLKKSKLLSSRTVAGLFGTVALCPGL
jgi:hypothetical protein